MQEEEFWPSQQRDAAFVFEPSPISGEEGVQVNPTTLADAVSTTLGEGERQFLFKIQNDLAFCAWCGTLFYELQNLGEYRCRCHLGMHSGQEWTCCGKRRVDAVGCVHAHHSANKEPVTERAVLYLSRPLQSQLAPWLSAASQLPLNETEIRNGFNCVVSRYNVEDVRIVQATRCDADEMRRERRLHERGFDGVSFSTAPQSNREFAERMRLANVPSRLWRNVKIM
jgi:hypothetical protein